jgi:hypothetical protein
MNIKSLLLGSAAALLAVSGARAADAVIAEPEPVEYVRVCDAYGAGFFYIPGTETCLSFSGYVWYQIRAEGFDDFGDTPAYYGGADFTEGWYKSIRTRLNVDARSETEWGTLRSFIRFQADFNPNAPFADPAGGPGGIGFISGFAGGSDGPVFIDQGYLQLGGLMMGYSESFWVDSKGGGGSNYGAQSWGGLYYGYQERALIAYRFQSDSGLFAAISLEDDGITGEGFIPDVVAKVAYTQGWGTVWATVGFDESRTIFVDPSALADADSGFAVALGANINIPNMPGSSIKLFGFYNDSNNAYGPGSPLGPDPEFSVLASLNYQINPTLGIVVSGQYFSDIYDIGGGDDSSGLDAWAADFSVVWMPVTNFEVRLEAVYAEVDGLDGTPSGYLRFTRYF